MRQRQSRREKTAQKRVDKKRTVSDDDNQDDSKSENSIDSDAMEPGNEEALFQDIVDKLTDKRSATRTQALRALNKVLSNTMPRDILSSRLESVTTGILSI